MQQIFVVDLRTPHQLLITPFGIMMQACSPCDDFETTYQVVIALAQSENLCNRVWQMNMADLVRNNPR